MAYVSVDVDLYEFTTDELIDELTKRAGRHGSRGLSQIQQAAVMTAVKEFYQACVHEDLGLSVKSIDDQAKLEAVQTAWPKLTAAQMEERLK